MKNFRREYGQTWRVKLPLLKLLTLVAVMVPVSLPSAAQAYHLFDPESGFHKARFGRSAIRVCDATGRVDLVGVIDPWNNAAGWRLFAPSCDMPDVVFQAGTMTLVQTTYLKPFTECVVQFASYRVQTLQHELAHCLGFADHVYAAEFGPFWVNPAVCDEVSHPAYAAYRGVVSYCESSTPHIWFGPDDQRMLLGAGYAIFQGDDRTKEVRVLGTKIVTGHEAEVVAARDDSFASGEPEASSSPSDRQRGEAASRKVGPIAPGGNATSSLTSEEITKRGASATLTVSYGVWAVVLAVLTLLISVTVASFRPRRIR